MWSQGRDKREHTLQVFEPLDQVVPKAYSEFIYNTNNFFFLILVASKSVWSVFSIHRAYQVPVAVPGFWIQGRHSLLSQGYPFG